MPRCTRARLLIFALLLPLLLTACPKKPREPGLPPEPEQRRPEIIYPNGEESPERQAANELMEEGIQALRDDDPEKAEWHLQEAIRIAPAYGPPYFWLARTKYELDDMTRAWDLLDRAELLIGQDPYWLERIDQLRQAISDFR